MREVTQSYLDGIKEGRATLKIIGSDPDAVRSMLEFVETQHGRSRGLAYGALADFVEFRRGEMDFWRRQVSKLGA